MTFRYCSSAGDSFFFYFRAAPSFQPIASLLITLLVEKKYNFMPALLLGFFVDLTTEIETNYVVLWLVLLCVEATLVHPLN